jgi:hypothetical protein
MKRPKGKSGSSLVEALFATAIVATTLVPIFVTFRTQLASADRIRSRMALSVAMERATISEESQFPPLEGSDAAKTARSDPELAPCGEATLSRTELFVTDSADWRRTRIFYSIVPAVEATGSAP